MRLRLGDVFGYLTVLSYEPGAHKPKRYARAVCRCDCGETCRVRVDHLYDQHTRSCGHDMGTPLNRGLS